MTKPIFLQNDFSGGNISPGSGYSLQPGSKAENMLTSIPRKTRIAMTGSVARIDIRNINYLLADTIAICNVKASNASVRFKIYAYYNTYPSGSNQINTGIIYPDRSNSGQWKTGRACNWFTANAAKGIQSMVLYIYGASGYEVEIGQILAGSILELEKCPQEPVLQNVSGGSMTETVSGRPVVKTPRRPQRAYSLSLSNMTEADREKMRLFEEANTNRAFLSSMYPDETGWRGRDFTMLSRFKSGMAYKRRRRTAYHQANAALIEA